MDRGHSRGQHKGQLTMSQAVAARPVKELLKWPAEGITHVPLQVYVDPEIYMWEQDRIFPRPRLELPRAGSRDSESRRLRHHQAGRHFRHRRAQRKRRVQRAGESLRPQGRHRVLSGRRKLQDLHLPLPQLE